MNLETMRLLVAKGLTAEDILEVAETMAAAPKSRSAAAERQARYRQRRGITEDEWAVLVRLVIERDGWICAYCDCNTSQEGHAIDHGYPVSRGGTNDLENLVMSCRSCNSSKGDRILDDEWTPPNDGFEDWSKKGGLN
jgi:5-methylcytosine-specific restriction endonuclease McrA